jgi:hypothetical protein
MSRRDGAFDRCIYFVCFDWRLVMSVATPFVPDPSDVELAQSALRDLTAALGKDGPVHLRFAEGADVVVPRSALTALTQILSTFAKGEGVTVLPAQEVLSAWCAGLAAAPRGSGCVGVVWW